MALSKITYANKSALNPQPSISEENKVTDANMNEIKSVVNNAIDQVDTNTTKIENISTYSTSEKVIGTWLGKPLYSKTFTGYSATGNYSHNIANVDHITIDSNGTFIKKTTGRTFPGNYYADGTADFASISANPQYIYIVGTIANLSAITVTLIYTKTTD